MAKNAIQDISGSFRTIYLTFQCDYRQKNLNFPWNPFRTGAQVVGKTTLLVGILENFEMFFSPIFIWS